MLQAGVQCPDAALLVQNHQSTLSADGVYIAVCHYSHRSDRDTREEEKKNREEDVFCSLAEPADLQEMNNFCYKLQTPTTRFTADHRDLETCVSGHERPLSKPQ